MRGRDQEVRHRVAQKSSDLRLVLHIAVAVKKADRDRLVAPVAQLGRQRFQLAFVRRLQHRAIGFHALRNLEDGAAGDQRVGIAKMHVVRLHAIAAPHLVHVPEALGGHEGKTSPLSLKEGIQVDRGAVQHGRRARPQFRLLERLDYRGPE